jgi:hypothetical protein
MLGGSVLPAKALLGIPTPPPPNAGQLQALATSLLPATPSVIVPTVNPDNPQLPNIPAAPLPPGLSPALGVLSPTTIATCQASYLGPIVGIVAMTAILDAAGIEPVKPSFLGPLFGPVTNACVLAPFPVYTSCGPDSTVTEQLASLPALPAVGPLPVPDPFTLFPAPLAAVVVVLNAIQADVAHYAYGGAPSLKFADRVAKQLDCTST